MKKLLSCLATCCLLILAACSGELPEQHVPVQSKRAILAYMVANNNLDDEIQNNLVWMYHSLSNSTDSCTLIVYYKPSAANSLITTPEILEYRTDGRGNINGTPALDVNIVDRNQINSPQAQAVIDQARHYSATDGLATDPDIMKANLQSMIRLASAQSYGLIFGSHATGWLPAPGTSVSTFSFGQDGPQEHAINLPELATTLEESFDGNLDFVLFDACMMGTAEVGYQLRNATHYCLASVLETPVPGYPYHRILNSLYQDHIDFTTVCNEIVAFNSVTPGAQWGTYAAIDCTQMQALADAVARTLAAHPGEADIDYSSAALQQYGYGQFRHFSFDLAEVMKHLNGGTLPADVQQALHRAIVAKSCLSGPQYAYNGLIIDAERFCGIGMYLPLSRINTTWDAYYRSAIAWYQAAGWQSCPLTLPAVKKE